MLPPTISINIHWCFPNIPLTISAHIHRYMCRFLDFRDRSTGFLYTSMSLYSLSLSHTSPFSVFFLLFVFFLGKRFLLIRSLHYSKLCCFQACFILDSGPSGIYIWIGLQCNKSERHLAWEKATVSQLTFVSLNRNLTSFVLRLKKSNLTLQFLLRLSFCLNALFVSPCAFLF